ncbi:hypothetical protein B0H11DRAFT_2237402 [Mycena galericulata]|nr:hypothetical protein B0H11DRAFT_2237402 [Mycena galericulata]
MGGHNNMSASHLRTPTKPPPNLRRARLVGANGADDAPLDIVDLPARVSTDAAAAPSVFLCVVEYGGIQHFRLYTEMRASKLWDVSFLPTTAFMLSFTNEKQDVKPAADVRSLLSVASYAGFQEDHRGLSTLIVGVDTRQPSVFYSKPSVDHSPSASIDACLEIHSGDQVGALRTLFYQFCNFQEAPLTPILVFDGPVCPAFKRGTKVGH